MLFVSKGCPGLSSNAAVGRDSYSFSFLHPEEPVVLLVPGSPLAFPSGGMRQCKHAHLD